MSAPLARHLERFRQLRADRTAAVAAALARAQAAARRTATPHAVGARVFDPITGLEGEVIHAARENIVVPAPDRADR